MDTNSFVEHFAEAIDVEASRLSPQTEFRQLDEWDSLAYMSIIAMIDEEYSMQIEQLEFKKLVTLQDIIDYIENNK